MQEVCLLLLTLWRIRKIICLITKAKSVPLHATEALGKGPPVRIVQEAGWTLEPVWTQRLHEKFFRLCRRSNLDRPVVQPIARLYTDWATRVTRIYGTFLK
jgi:hypothetical protein